MTLFYQETDFRLVLAVPWRATQALALNPPDETIGGRPDACLVGSAKDLLEPARRSVRRIENRDVRERAESVLDAIQQAISTLAQYVLETCHLPPWGAFGVDDGSVLIEWAFPDLRLGFSVEPNPEDSSWYLVSTSELGDINASGYFSAANLRKLVPWLLQLVLSYVSGESNLWNSQRTASGASQTATFSPPSAW